MDVEIEGLRLTNVHEPSQCRGRNCVIHNPSLHHMHSWRLHWRQDRGIFERICEHGVGHPDPDQFEFWHLTNQDWQGVHGCDLCCQRIDFIEGEVVPNPKELE
jgi:hypothetical protein